MTSLLLFNEEGESHVTTVDIANEMDISPGNLYYHFKGKEVIIESLYTAFDSEITDILQAPMNRELKVEDGWYYLYVVFEEMYRYRFIYSNLSDLLQRYENIKKRFRRLLNLKHQTAATLISSLKDAGIITIDDISAMVLIDNIVMTLTYWIAYENLRDSKQDATTMLHKGVFQVLTLVAPFLNEGQVNFREFCQNFYRKALGGQAESMDGSIR